MATPWLTAWAYAHAATNVLGGWAYFTRPKETAGVRDGENEGVLLRVRGLGHTILLVAALMAAVPSLRPRERAVVAGLLAANDLVMLANVGRAFAGGFKGDALYSPGLLGVVAVEGACFATIAALAARQRG